MSLSVSAAVTDALCVVLAPHVLCPRALLLLLTPSCAVMCVVTFAAPWRGLLQVLVIITVFTAVEQWSSELVFFIIQ